MHTQETTYTVTNTVLSTSITEQCGSNLAMDWSYCWNADDRLMEVTDSKNANAGLIFQRYPGIPTFFYSFKIY